MEKAMYYAKKHGLKAGTFNYHSVPWNDERVCCMVEEFFKNGDASWNKYSAINALKEIIERGKMSFSEFDDKFYGHELHPGYRLRLMHVWDFKVVNCFNFDFCEGMVPVGYDENGHLIWKFDPSRIGEGYENLIKMFGGR